MSPLDPRHVNLLLASASMLKLVRSERGHAFRDAWLDAATGAATDLLRIDAERLPASPARAARMAFQYSLQVCEGLDVNRPDLVAEFNTDAQPEFARGENLDDAIGRLFAALLSLTILRERQWQAAREAKLQQVAG